MTKLSPKTLLSTLMGAWFLATAFSQYLAGVISQFTSSDTTGASASDFPPPTETVNIYGDVFLNICIAGIIAGLICALLSPLLKYWMHQDVVTGEES